MALCTGCKKVMTHIEFDQHNCPANPGPPLDGESWDDYVARCDEFKKQWEANNADDELTLPQMDSMPEGPIEGYDY